MLTKLEIMNTTILTDGVAFDPSGSASTDLLQIRNISGLDPVAANMSLTPYASIDGELLTGANVGKRNIVITVGFRPDPFAGHTVASLRETVYRYFMPKSTLTMLFSRLGMPDATISGTVENVEANHFSKNPELQISIICPDPYFLGTTKNVISGNVLTAAQDSPNNYTPIEYSGSVPVGFELLLRSSTLSLNDTWHVKTIAPAVQTFTLYAQSLTPTLGIDFSTIEKARYVKTSSGISLLGKVVDNSVWPVLHPGANVFAWVADGITFATNAAPTWTLSYYNLYGGV